MARHISLFLTVPLPEDAMAAATVHEKFAVALKQFVASLEPGEPVLTLAIVEPQTVKPRRHRRARPQLTTVPAA